MAMIDLLPFDLAEQQLALPLADVKRVLPILHYAALPGAPEPIVGVANLRGQVVPVADLRIRFGWSAIATRLWSPVIWTGSRQRQFLLPVDRVRAASRHPDEHWLPITELPVSRMLLRGVVCADSGLLLIQDLDALLSVEEWEQLRDALAANGQKAS